ncbi:MAG: D-glycero-beta-D-manno-heptose 1-phosphate adenylyltransferase [Epsilonproteobacteria bacterium]|nr:D-glycero-beta-D-manno-heptose 1-phosphate adenylyltransferase [Campylobacterota bacterium]NPA89330.1 D-glycero-beta-D-manno-heptose 1-phosphate adenylyltransferase [Campylobacterota bacterium]
MIGVIGDFMIDHYIFGKSSRISPEAPVPVVNLQREEDRPGGAGNVVKNLLSLGAKPVPIGVVGEGEYSRLVQLLPGVETAGLFSDPTRPTPIKTRIIAGTHQMVRVDRETTAPISPEMERKILKFLEERSGKWKLLLLSDYGKGVLTPRLTSAIIKFANRHQIRTIIDPKRDYFKYRNGWLLKPNRKELGEAVGMEIKTDADLQKAGWRLKEELNLDYLLVTLSEEGMALFGEEFLKIPTLAREVYDVTGAGDSVLAGLGYSLIRGAPLEEAIHFANSTAAVAISRVGTTPVKLSEVLEFQKRLDNSVDYKIVGEKEIGKIVEELKEEGKKIVFTNGCFDILHYGHIRYLQKAKKLGDVLIVGLNSDESVKRLKGEKRPINPQYQRAYLLASLEVVDFVVIFEEDTPEQLIKIVTPDILVKGGDYRNKKIVGADIAKEVKLIEFVEGESTTSIITRILERYGRGEGKGDN